MARTRGRPGICAYCGEHAAALEDEHVFPNSWYPSSTPTGAARIKVPSCPKCNRDAGQLEERLQRSWAACIDLNNPAAIGIWDRVHRSLRAEDAHNERDAKARAGNRKKLLAAIQPIPIEQEGRFPGFAAQDPSFMLQSSGSVVVAANAISIEARHVASITEKFVRGLHFATHGSPVPTSVKIDTYVVHERAWSEMLNSLESSTPQGVPPGFVFWHRMAKENPMFAVWYFVIWGQIFLQASTTPIDLSEQS
jgi:hypothetical protein